MASKADIKAGGAFVELFVRGAKFDQGLATYQAKFQSFGAGMSKMGAVVAAAGAAILAPLAAAVHHFSEVGGDLNDMAHRTGLAAEKLAFLKYAADQTGASIEDIEKAIKFAAKNGFSPENFEAMAEEIARIPDPAARAARAMELFGKSGTMLIPMFEELADLQARWTRLGIGPTKESIALADELGDLWGDLKASAAAIAYEIGAALAPAMKELAQMVAPMVSQMVKWIRENPQAVVMLGALAVAAVAFGTALVVVGGAIAAAAAAIGVLLTEGAAIIATIAFIGIAVTAAVVAFLRWTTVGQRLFAFFTKGLKGLSDLFAKTFKGVGDALKAGDIETAWKLALMGMTAHWQRFMAKVLTDLADLAEKLIPFGGILGGPGAAFGAGALREAARGYRLDAGLTESNQKMLAAQAAKRAAMTGQGGRPQDYPVGLQGAGIIGTNAFSALRSRQVIGGGRNKVEDTLTKQLALDAKIEKHLREIDRKTRPPRFR